MLSVGPELHFLLLRPLRMRHVTIVANIQVCTELLLIASSNLSAHNLCLPTSLEYLALLHIDRIETVFWNWFLNSSYFPTSSYINAAI